MYLDLRSLRKATIKVIKPIGKSNFRPKRSIGFPLETLFMKMVRFDIKFGIKVVHKKTPSCDFLIFRLSFYACFNRKCCFKKISKLQEADFKWTIFKSDIGTFST